MSAKFYLLKNKETGVFATWWARSNSDKDFCVPNQFLIEFDQKNEQGVLYTLNSHEEAERVLQKSTEWFNAGYFTPTWEETFKQAVKEKLVEIVGIDAN